MPYQMISSLMTADVSRYVVDDLVGHLRCGRTSTILLFESPHTSEVIEGYPLAGKAGARVAKAFLGTDARSIGEILSSWQNIPSDSILRHIGIMNVCRLPMQGGPYRWSWRQHDVLHHLSIIREGPGAGSRNEVNTKLSSLSAEKSPANSLERRLSCAINRPPKQAHRQQHNESKCADTPWTAFHTLPAGNLCGSNADLCKTWLKPATRGHLASSEKPTTQSQLAVFFSTTSRRERSGKSQRSSTLL